MSIWRRIKKKGMEYVWRMQMVQGIAVLPVWALMITGIFYPILYPAFKSWGIVGTGEHDFLVGMVYLFLLIVGIWVVSGLSFDKFMYNREKIQIEFEKNPYAEGQMFPKEIEQYRYHLAVGRAMEMVAKELNLPHEDLKSWNAEVEKWVKSGYVIEDKK